MLILSLILFWLLLLGVISSSPGLAQFDTVVRDFIIPLRTSGLTEFFTLVTSLFSPWSLISIALVIMIPLILRGRWRVVIWSAATLAFSGGSMELIKWFVHRVRPSDGLLSLTDPSFPSGHATVSMVFFGLAAYLVLPYIRSEVYRSIIVLIAGLLIFLVGLSRVYLGVHYPSDVLGGWVLGIVWVTGVMMVLRR